MAVTNASKFVVEYAYDIMDRVTNISWQTASGATLGGFEYEYDAVGRIVSRSHAIGSNAFDRAYAYDDLKHTRDISSEVDVERADSLAKATLQQYYTHVSKRDYFPKKRE